MMKQANILIADELGDDSLVANLCQSGYQAAAIKLQNLDLITLVETVKPDIIILNVYTPTHEILAAIAHINESNATPIIMFAEDQSTETINQVIKAGVCAYIVDGYETKRIKTIVDIAVARFKEQQNLKQELAKTKIKLEERKLIDQAKSILIKTQSVSEDEAYHALRKLAMENNMTMGEIAKNVISMSTLLKKS